jgi:serine/threonine-protein kinase
VPFDQFKTQVLLLHSEQNTLDKLSAGFGDRYTVHCATSGSEALNTLGDTPIHVIVSAQHLPGMSGAEALREAKRRSPDTLGILLTGENEGAIVGEKELFQVVRGGISTADLIQLVDSVTQQTRLMALAESANDTAANPDEPVAEHIVMETSENGASIISDGTGQMPVLNPTKVAASAAVGAATVDVLVITKDEEFLATVRESTRGMHNVRSANTLKQAESAVRESKVGVAVVDAAMVGNNVEQLTQHLRKLQKRLVAIVAGRRDDGEMLMDLINRGKVYRFLLKPVSPGRARLAIEASVKHHLEAPDSAFKTSPAAPPTAKPAADKPAAKPKPVAVPEKPAPKADAKPAAKPAPKPEPKSAAAKAAKPALSIKATRDEALAPVDDGLSDAFDDDSGFTKTMTGIVETVTKSISGKKSDDDKATPAPSESITGSGGGESSLNPKLLGLGAAAVVAVAGIGYWLFGGSDGPAAPEEATTNTPAITEAVPSFDREAPVVDEPAIDIDELLEDARDARDEGDLFNPPGSNAIELYLVAIASAPNDSIVLAELDAVLDETLAMAETALLEKRTVDSAAALERVSLARPNHPRLPFLNAQLQELQLRDYLVSARDAIRDGRLEDSTTAIAGARALDIEDDGEIAMVEDELVEARSSRRVDEVLALATARLESGSLTSPANDNARYYFQLALSNDPDNAAALAGLSVIASKIVLQAREEIDGGRFNTAEALLVEARQLDPSSDELAATSKALADAEQRVEDERLRAEAERRAAAEREAEERRLAEEREAAARLAEEQRLENERLAAEAAAALAAAEAAREAAVQAAAAPSAAAAGVSATGTDSESAAAESAAADETPPETAVEVAPETGAGPDSTLTAAEPEPPKEEASAPVPVRNQSPVAASSLTRTKYVAPKYPRSAERRNLAGWVDVIFTVAVDGTVKDIEIKDSQPDDTFVKSATRAVERWEFEPVVENGEVVEKRAGVRLMFALQ